MSAPCHAGADGHHERQRPDAAVMEEAHTRANQGREQVLHGANQRRCGSRRLTMGGQCRGHRVGRDPSKAGDENEGTQHEHGQVDADHGCCEQCHAAEDGDPQGPLQDGAWRVSAQEDPIDLACGDESGGVHGKVQAIVARVDAKHIDQDER